MKNADIPKILMYWSRAQHDQYSADRPIAARSYYNSLIVKGSEQGRTGLSCFFPYNEEQEKPDKD